MEGILECYGKAVDSRKDGAQSNRPRAVFCVSGAKMRKSFDLYSEVFGEAMHSKRFEPEMRNKDGVRYVGHRFPIKGGISAWDVIAKNVLKNNALLQKLVNKNVAK